MSWGGRARVVEPGPYRWAQHRGPHEAHEAARRSGHVAWVMDMVSVRVSPGGAVSDASGSVDIDVLAPFLLYGQPTGAYALSELNTTVPALNSVAAVQVADDKWASSLVLGSTLWRLRAYASIRCSSSRPPSVTMKSLRSATFSPMHSSNVAWSVSKSAIDMRRRRRWAGSRVVSRS